MLRQAQARSMVAVFPVLEARLASVRRAAFSAAAAAAAASLASANTGCAECGGEDDVASVAETEAGEACAKMSGDAVPTEQAPGEEGCGCESGGEAEA